MMKSKLNWLKDYKYMSLLYGLMLVATISSGVSFFAIVGTLIWGTYIFLNIPDIWKKSKIVFSLYTLLLIWLLCSTIRFIWL